MEKFSIKLLFVIFSIVVGSCKDTDDNENSTVPGAEKEFVLSIGEDGLFLVNAGQVSIAKSDSAEIKEYSDKMVKDYTQILEEVKELAAARSLTISGTLPGARQEKLDSLSARNGNELDSLFLNMIVLTHTEMINRLEEQAASGSDLALRSWAAQKAPFVKTNLSIAQSLYHPGQ